MQSSLPTQVKRRYLSVAEFCAANGISRAFLYKLWKCGNGPARMRIGDRVLIPADAELCAPGEKQ
jgi:predicted DNA-binding transcriptional regulator AlpA